MTATGNLRAQDGLHPRQRGPWESVPVPGRAPVRAAAARVLLRRVADRCGISVVLPDGGSMGPPDGPVMRVVDLARLFTRLGRDGKIGLGEAYMAGEWEAPDLAAVLEAMARHVDTLVPPRLQWLRRLHERRPPAHEDNDRRGARDNVTRHYDLSNDLFAAFLDPSMTYSAALFDDTGASLFDDTGASLLAAQERKIDRLLDATGVGAGTRLLEIGTGWGELAVRAARRGAHVTGLTLSAAQGELVRRRVEAEGVAGAVDVHVEDYRDVRGAFDAVVSVEMIEAVGARWWPAYFRALQDRLAPGGRIGLQAIVMGHDHMRATRRSWTWIHKYIFPGGQIPSEQAIDESLAPTSLSVVDRLAFGDSYARTLRLWRERFAANAALVEGFGFDRTFRRMWDFYLAYSEAGFRSGYLDVVQLVLARDAR